MLASNLYCCKLFKAIRGRSQVTSRLRGEGGIRICDNPNIFFLFLWIICDKGEGVKKVVFCVT